MKTRNERYLMLWSRVYDKERVREGVRIIVIGKWIKNIKRRIY